MDELVADIVVVVVVCTPWVLPHFVGRLAKSPAFFLTFGALQLALAVGGYALGWSRWTTSFIAILGAYDIWRSFKVRRMKPC
jgi:NO-binding membrane sensor protein with MHYT domain